MSKEFQNHLRDLEARGDDPLVESQRVAEQAKQSAAQANVYSAGELHPDINRNADVHELAQRFGTSPDVVDSAFDQFQKEDRLSEAMKHVSANPSLSWWARRDPEHARLMAPKDWGQEAERSSLFERAGQRYRFGQRTTRMSEIGHALMLDLGNEDLEAELTRLRSFPQLEEMEGFSFGRFVEGSAELAPFMLDVVGAGVTTGAAAAAVPAAATALGFIEPVSTAVGIAATGTAFKVGTTAGVIYRSAQLESGSAFLEFRDLEDEDGNKIEPEVAALAASIYGPLAGAVEALALKPVVAAVPGGKALLSQFSRAAVKDLLKRRTVHQALSEYAKVVGLAVGAQIGEEMIQYVAQIFAQEQIAKPLSQVDLEPLGLKEFGEGLSDTAEKAFYGMLLFGAGPATVGLTWNLVRARDTNQSVQFFEDLAEGVSKSELKKRARGPFQRLVAHQATEGGVPVLRIPVEAWDEYFQPINDDPGKAASDAGIEDEYRAAKKVGGDMEIPTAVYADMLAGTEHNGPLSRNIRISANGLTIAEADEFRENFAEELTAIVNDAESRSAQMRGLQSDTDFIEEQIVRQLEQAKQFTPEIRQTYATLIAQGYQALASRNEAFNTRELFAGHRLRVVGPNQAVPETVEDQVGAIDEQVKLLRLRHGTEGEVASLKAEREDLISQLAPTLELRRRGFGGWVDRVMDWMVDPDPGALPTAAESGGFGLEATPDIDLQREVAEMEAAIATDLELIRENREPPLPKGIAKYPVLRAIANMGGVASDSGLADQLRAINIKDTKVSGVIRKAPGKEGQPLATALDQLDWQGRGFLWESANEEGGGVDDAEILDAIKDEIQLRPHHPAHIEEQIAERNEGIGQLKLALRDADIDPSDMTDREVAEALVAEEHRRSESEALARRTEATLRATDEALEESDEAIERSRGIFEAVGPEDGEELFQPQKAHHGTGVRELEGGRLSTSKKGTGEGFAAFGHGIYLATKRGIAEAYRKIGTNRTEKGYILVGGKPVSFNARNAGLHEDSANYVARRLTINLLRFGGNRKEAIEALRSDLKEKLKGRQAAKDRSKAVRRKGADVQTRTGERFADRLSKLNQFISTGISFPDNVVDTRGQVFEVHVPDDSELLAWDAKLKDQPEGVREKIAPLVQTVLGSPLSDQNEKRVKSGDITGMEFYYWLGGALVSPEQASQGVEPDVAASEALNEAGVPGHRFLDGDSRNTAGGELIGIDPVIGTASGFRARIKVTGRGGIGFGTPTDQVTTSRTFNSRQEAQDWADRKIGGGTYNYVIWDEDVLEIVGELHQPPREEGGKKGSRGGFKRIDTGAMIRLSQSRDLSTFIHEAGHLFLDMLELSANTPGASQQTIDDYNRLRQVLGAAEGQPLGRAEHEKFADFFTQFTYGEGNAPSAELRGVFHDFRAYLMSVYKNFRKLFGVDPPQEVQDIMGRMLASDEQIEMQAAQDGFVPAFREDAPHGMTEAEFTSYRAIAEDAARQAKDNQQARVLRNVRRWLMAEWSGERARVKAEVEEDYRKLPRIQAREWISTGVFIGDPEDPLADSLSAIVASGHMRLRQEEIEADYGGEILRSLPKGPKTGILSAKGAEGHLYSDIASEFGYTNPDDFIRDMQRTKSFKQEVEAETKRRFTAPKPDEVDVVTSARLALSNPGYLKMVRSQLALIRRLRAQELQERAAEEDVRQEGPGTAVARQDAVVAARQAMDEASVAWQIAYEGGSDALMARAQTKMDAAITALDAALARREASRDPRREAAAKDRALRLQAQQRIAVIPHWKLRPSDLIADMRRASERLRVAVSRGDWESAEREQGLQIYYLHAYRAAEAAKARGEKLVKSMQAYTNRPAQERFEKAGGQFKIQMNRLLAGVALRGPMSRTEQERAAALEDWKASQLRGGDILLIDPERLQAILQRRHWRELNLSELEELAVNMKAISKGASKALKTLQGIDAQELEDKVEELSTGILSKNARAVATRAVRLGAGAIPPSIRRAWGGDVPNMPGLPETPPWHEVGRQWFRKFHAEFTHMETFMLWLDGNEELGANYRFFITEGARKAQADEDALKDEMAAGIRNVFRRFTPKERRHLPSKAWAEDGSRAVFIPELGLSLTHEQRIMFAANVGNPYNLGALKAGYGLDQGSDSFGRQVDAVLATLDDRDWDTVQDMWDMLDTFWERIAAHQEAMTGIRPERVQARAFTTPDGREMRGGYFPLRADSQKNPGQVERRVERLTESLLTRDYVVATTKHGMVKARKDWGDQKVLLNLGVYFGHLHDVAHDLSHRRFVRDSMRMIDRKEFQEAVTDAAGKEYVDVMRAWVNRLSELTLTPLGATESLAKRARVGATVVNMGLKVSVLMAQWTAIIPAAVVVGPRATARGSVLVASSWSKAIGEKMFGMTIDPDSDSRRFAMERSQELQHRMKSWDRDVSAARAEFGFGGTAARITALQFWAIGYIDLQVATASWLAGYDQGLRDGMSETDAMAYGDRIVSTTQGGAKPYQLAEIQTGSELRKSLTMFYTFWSAMYNLTSERSSKARRGDAAARAKFIHEMFWLYVMMPMVAEILAGRGPSDDDEPWDTWAAKAIGANVLSPVPILRNVSSVVMGWKFQYTPVEQAFESPLLLGTDLVKRELDRDTLDHLINTVGYFSPFKLGTRQLTGMIRQVEALMENGDFSMKKLIYGRPPKRRRRTKESRFR